jgi:hypothetical protein
VVKTVAEETTVVGCSGELGVVLVELLLATYGGGGGAEVVVGAAGAVDVLELSAGYAGAGGGA